MKFVKIAILALLLAFLSGCTSTSDKGVTISNSWFSSTNTVSVQSNA